MIYRKMQETKHPPLKTYSYVHAVNRSEVNTVISALFFSMMQSRTSSRTGRCCFHHRTHRSVCAAFKCKLYKDSTLPFCSASPGSHIHRVNIISIDQRVEFCGGSRLQIILWSSQQQRHLLPLVELLQIKNGLSIQTHAGQGLRKDNNMHTFSKKSYSRNKREISELPCPLGNCNCACSISLSSTTSYAESTSLQALLYVDCQNSLLNAETVLETRG